jgi:hypothetical protein
VGLTGARLVGRWASGAPVQLTHLHDDLTLAANPKNRYNNFFFDSASQMLCPFAPTCAR